MSDNPNIMRVNSEIFVELYNDELFISDDDASCIVIRLHEVDAMCDALRILKERAEKQTKEPTK